MPNFVRVALQGQQANQQIINILWYRPATDFGSGSLFYDALAAVAEAVYEQIWNPGGDGSGPPWDLRSLMPNTYTLDNIQVDGYDDAYALVSSAPFVRTVNEAGGLSTETNGPTTCVIMRAQLEPVLGPGIGLPKRGYIALSPVPDVAIDDGGQLTTTWLDRYDDFGDLIGQNLETTVPLMSYFPIRVRLTRVLGLITVITWKDVSDFHPRQSVSFRKSRQPEA